MEKKICCFTGHRRIPEKCLDTLPDHLETTLEALVKLGFTSFRTGGAIGFDTLAALKVLELRDEKYPFITLDLILPCKDQCRGWRDMDIMVYDHVLSRADSVEYIQESYSSGCMYKRNRALVDGSEVCISFKLNESGGTAYTEKYAISKGVKVINLAYRY